MFYERFGKIDLFGWWNIERNKTDAGTQFISKYFHEGISVCGVLPSRAAPDHQEMNGQVEVKWITS